VAAIRIDVYCGATISLNISSTTFTASVNIAMAATKIFYLDGGGDTYINERIANQICFTAGGTEGMRLLSGTSRLLINQNESSGSTTSAISVDAANAGAGDCYGMAFTAVTAGDFFPFSFDDVHSTAALGAYYGKIQVKIAGATKYIPIYS